MKKYLIPLLCLILILWVGCSLEPATSVYQVEVEEDYKVTIPNINIKTPKGIDIEILDADPIYIDREDTKETLLTVRFIIRNNTDKTLKAIDYNIYISGYSTDGKLLFERDSRLFTAKEIAAKTYTEGMIYTGFMRGIEKIDRLDVVIE
ncbi:MAG: hypothetical protein GX947_07645 [Tissierellia bacterium]|nr:hypothetical protein [Tissierellia bacterium]